MSRYPLALFAAALFLIPVLASLLQHAYAQATPTTEERVAALETRVAALETWAWTPTPVPTPTDTPTATITPTSTPSPAPWAGCTVIARTSDQWRVARNNSRPGDVICLAPGEYRVSTPWEIRRSGTPDAWIAYRSMDPANPAVVKGASGSNDLFQVFGAGYIQVSDLVFDGEGVYSNGIGCKGGHHVRALRNVVRNTGSGGIVAYRDPAGTGCDYLEIVDNRIGHVGYRQGWSSAISLNGVRWHDRGEGFHSVIARNTITGTHDASFHHSDGNGIILDVSGDAPPTLVTGNVVSTDGGRCLHALNTDNGWWIGNTCYGNGLDPAVAGGAAGNNGEFVLYGSAGHVAANNVFLATGDGRAISDERGTPARYQGNIAWGGGPMIGGSNDRVQVMRADPMLADPPPAVDGGHMNAPAPDAALVARLAPLSGSPAIGAGVDPTTLAGLSPAMRAQVAEWTATDALGRARPPDLIGAVIPTP